MAEEYRQHRFSPAAGAADILLIRHGETEAAQPGKSFALKDGHGDPALHPAGEAQAVAVGERLKHQSFAAIYVTKLRRTHQTAAPLAAYLGLDPIIDPDLHEVHLGDWDGGAYRMHAANQHPAFLRAKEHQEWGEIPGAETTVTLHDRVKRGLLRIAAAHPDQKVAVVVHGGVVGAAMALATGAQAFAFNGAANGSISRIIIKDDAMIVQGFNDCAHLV